MSALILLFSATTFFLPAFALPKASVLEARDQFYCGDKQDFSITCNGGTGPANWNDCITAFGQLLNDHSGGFAYPGIQGGDNTWVQGSGSCTVFVTVNEFGTTMSTAEAEVDWYKMQEQCQIQGAGGQVYCPSQYGGTGAVSVAAAGAQPSPKNNTTLIDAGKRSVNLQLRDDNQFELASTTVNARPQQYRQHIIGLGPGGSWTRTSDQSWSSTIEISESISAGLEGIASTTLGFDVSSTQSYSYSETVTEPNNCPDNEEAQIYWQPFFTEYNGGFYPDGPYNIQIYKPQTTPDNNADGEYVVVCGSA